MERRFKFTSYALGTLPVPKHGKVRYFDTGLNGHCIRVTAKGVLTFGVYKRLPLTHRVVDITIGKWPDLSISESRKIAHEHLRQIAKGVNPNQEKRAAKEDLTLGELYGSVRENEFSQIKSLHKYSSFFKCHLQAWSNKRLSEITPLAVQTLHARIGKEVGHHSANRVLELLSSLFNKARIRGFDKPNPTSNIRHFKEKSRDRFVQS